MRAINKIKVMYQGELLTKTVRSLLKKTGLIKAVKKIPRRSTFSFHEHFVGFDKDILDESLNSSTCADFSNFELMGEKINLLQYHFEDCSEQAKWFYVQLPRSSDVRTKWEVNRLQFLSLMALCYLETNNMELLTKIEKLIEEWYRKNPFDTGINWVSNLEVSIRSISLTLVYLLMKPNITELPLKEMLFEHMFHIRKDICYTQHCMPNNHLTGEATALYILCNLIEYKESSKWIKKSRQILLDQLEFIRDDGTFLEASVSYHRFVLQMYILVYFFSRKSGDELLQKQIFEKLSKSYIFLRTIQKPDLSFPQFGDSDDGLFYRLCAEQPWEYESFMQTLGYIIGHESKRSMEATVLESLFGHVENTLDEGPKDQYQCLYEIFPDGKYGIYKDNKVYFFINNQDQVFHSHSDGLSIELSIDGKDVLIDSGTYNYNLDHQLRKYFRSTAAHNTVYLGFDQSDQVGTFRWANQPKTVLKKLDNATGFNGTVVYKNGAVHKRIVMISKGEILIEDHIKTPSKYIEANFHFPPNVSVQVVNDREITLHEVRVLFTSDKDFQMKVAESYYSPSYNKLLKRKNIKIISKENEQILRTKFIF